MRLKFLAPAGIFLALAALLAFGLTSDPSRIPSVLIDKPAPEFDLAPVPGRGADGKPGLSTADLEGQVSLVNVFASWCLACKTEHPILMRLAEDGVVPVFGLNYKDAPEDAARWLEEMGDPYARIGMDRDGRVGIDWGVYGVPESFVVDAKGRIRYKQIGPITENDLDKTILPVIERLKAENAAPRVSEARAP